MHIHTTKKVSSRLTLFNITQEIFNQNCLFKNVTHAEFSYTHFEWSFTVHNPPLYCAITEEKKVALFVKIMAYGASIHDIEIPAQNSMQTIERLVDPLNKSATFFQHSTQ